MRRQRPRCDQRRKYRSADGTCNNLKQPSWGSYAQHLGRFMGPEYGDGNESCEPGSPTDRPTSLCSVVVPLQGTTSRAA